MNDVVATALFTPTAYPFNAAWRDHLKRIMVHGRRAAPRGRPVIELVPPEPLVVNARFPIIRSEARRLGYRFMCAEAAWILSGDNRVESILPFARHIKDFSDDGETFFGAYGPKLVHQWRHCRQKLEEDPDTRQAVINIWREQPPASKDIPCTLSYTFSLRSGANPLRKDDPRYLDILAYMRSSDAWLGVVYDVFTQAMIATAMAAELQQTYGRVEPGRVVLQVANAHLYEKDLHGVGRVLSEPALGPDYRPIRVKDVVDRNDLAGRLWDLAHLDGVRGEPFIPEILDERWRQVGGE